MRRWEAEGDIRVYDEMKLWTFRVAVENIVGFDDSWVSPTGFPSANKLFIDLVDGLFRWVAPLHSRRDGDPVHAAAAAAEVAAPASRSARAPPTAPACLPACPAAWPTASRSPSRAPPLPGAWRRGRA